MKNPLGIGPKHPQLDIPIENLFLDPENPRLPEEAQKTGEPGLLKTLFMNFSLNELAESMANNGYFDEEPLVAIPINLPKNLNNVSDYSVEFLEFINKPGIKFIVVEGNRRLATAKILLDQGIRNDLRASSWPTISPEVRKDLSVLPVIIYKNRKDVIPYLGVRHIVGIQKWESFAKARYIASMIENKYTIEQISNQIGDKSNALLRNYICYKIIDQAESEFDYDSKSAKKDFSFLLLAVGQGKIKKFIGLPTKLSDADLIKPVPDDKLDNLRKLLTWIYGFGDLRPAIRESRDITNYLSQIVDNVEAVKYLESTNNIIAAYDRTSGEETMLMKYLHDANTKLETALGLVYRHKVSEVISEVNRTKEIVDQLIILTRE